MKSDVRQLMAGPSLDGRLLPILLALACISTSGVSSLPASAADAISETGLRASREAGFEVPEQTIAPAVPLGFHSISSRREDDGPLEIELWGRQYIFREGPLPTEIRSLGRAIFRGAPRFEIVIGGRPATIDWSPITVSSESAQTIRLRSRGRAGSALLDSETTVEYDGMIRVSLEIASDETIRIDRFEYRLPIDASVARFFNRHLTYDYTTMRVKRDVLLETAGLLPPSPLALPYVPSVSLGDREIGLEWWGDSAANWTSNARGRSSKPILLSGFEDHVELKVTPIASAHRLRPGHEWTHEFALFVFPMREKPTAVHANRFLSPGEARDHAEQPWLRLYSIFFPGQFDARWHGLPASIDSPKQRKLRERLSRLGVGYVPYAKLTAAPSLHPKTMATTKTWSAAGKLFRGPAGGERKFMMARGWTPGTPFSYAACGTEREYFDWILQETLTTIREESPAAIYYDWGSIMEPCRDRKRDGALAWGYFELRSFYRRLYEAIKTSTPEILITIHTHGQPRAIGAFVDYVFVGEALNVAFRDSRPFREIRANPRLYKPHYMDLPEGFLDAQFFPRTGGTIALLPEVHLGRDKSDPNREVALTREMFAETLVSDIAVWLTNSDVATRTAIMSAVDRFGDLDEAQFRPWWRDPLGVAGVPGVRASAYTRRGTALAVVSNRNDAPVRVSLQPDLQALGVESARQYSDPERPSVEPTKLIDGEVAITVPARDFRLVWIR